MQSNAGDPDVCAFEELTRVLVGIAWDGADAAPDGVTFPQVRLLLVLGDLGPVPCSRLAAALGVNASSVTRMADRLATCGYLDRSGTEGNRSVVLLTLTDAGRELVELVLRRRHAAIAAVLDRLPSTHRTSAGNAARRFTGAAAAVPAAKEGLL